MFKAEPGKLLATQGDLVNRDVFILLKGFAAELKKSAASPHLLNQKSKEQQIIKDIAELSKEEGEEDLFISQDQLKHVLCEHGCEYTAIPVGEPFGENVLQSKAARTSSLVAISESVYIVFSKMDFQIIKGALEEEKKRVKDILKQAFHLDFSVFN